MKKHIIASLIAIILIFTASLSSVFTSPDIRDLAVSIRADKLQKGSDFVPDYGRTTYTYGDWGMYSNSKWLLDEARIIVPYFSYENINSVPDYPQLILFVPMTAESSFHLGGQTNCSDKIIINEKFAMLDSWKGMDLLSTLVHELAHVQKGVFCGDRANSETMTQVATVEVLAGMCNHGVELSCDSFWNEFGDMAEQSIRTRWMARYKSDIPWQIFEDTFIRDAKEKEYSAKSTRHWFQDEVHKSRLEYIIEEYGSAPYNDYMLNYLCGGLIATGHADTYLFGMNIMFNPVQFKLDDTKYLLTKQAPWYLWALCGGD